MTTKKQGIVTFEVDGESYAYRLTTNAIVAFEESQGEGVAKALDSLRTATSFRTLRALLWAGLKGGGGELTLEQTGDLIDALGIERAGNVIAEGVEAAYPDSTSGAEGASPAGGSATPGNGKGRKSAA